MRGRGGHNESFMQVYTGRRRGKIAGHRCFTAKRVRLYHPPSCYHYSCPTAPTILLCDTLAATYIDNTPEVLFLVAVYMVPGR